ncbi:MAG: hypothetical protein Q8O25_10745 [Sulfurisoma sp.]|nr:hypothetical protein [Sulfurisoma sp.]
MQGRIKRLILTCSALLAAAVVATPSQAIPAFARQAGKACNTCHFQHYPALNEYGQEFKAGGFVDMGKQGTIKGKELSLPDVLNASVFTKIRYQKNSGRDLPGELTAASGEWQVPDEFALLFGGRVTENIGYMLEGQLANGAAPVLAGFKMPMMFKVGDTGAKAGVIPYTTDALGASYGFELLNTGAVRNVRIMEHRNESSAQQYIGTATPAMGLAFVAWHPSFFVNFSKWSPNHAAVAEERASGDPTSSYFRAAWTPTVGDWGLGIGYQKWGGTSRVDLTAGLPCAAVNPLATGVAGEVGECRTEAWAFDVQAQGAVGGMPLGVYFTNARAPGTGVGQMPNLYNTNRNTETASTITLELGIIPNKATLMLAYRVANTGRPQALDVASGVMRGTNDNAWTVGGTYQFSQNVQLQLLSSNRSRDNGYQGSDTAFVARGRGLTTLMLSAGF